MYAENIQLQKSCAEYMNKFIGKSDYDCVLSFKYVEINVILL